LSFWLQKTKKKVWFLWYWIYPQSC